MKRKLIYLVYAAALLVMSGCINSSETGKPVITVSIEPQRWLLEQIVGDRMEVRTLLSSGGDPESYEPAFSHLTTLERSRCYMCVGNLGFESAVIDKIRANNPDLKIVNVSDSIEYIVSDESGHDHGIDPHVWSSAANARIMAENMLRNVSALDPEHANEYNSNFIALIARIDSVDLACRKLLAPLEGASFVVWHPSLSYFARDYGLHQIAVGAEGKEPSVGKMQEIIDRIGCSDASVFLIQMNFDSSRAESVASSKPDMTVTTINPLNYDWDYELLQTARAIARQ